MATSAGAFVLAQSNNWVIGGANSNDLLIFTGNSNQSIFIGSSNTSNANLVIASNGFIGIGKSNPASTLDVSGTVNISGVTTVASNIMPLSNLVYDLGSSASRFRSLYLGSNTIDMSGIQIHVDSATGGLKITDSNNSNATLIVNKIVLGTTSNSVTMNLDANNNIQFGTVTSVNGVTTSNNATVGGWSNSGSNVFIIGSNIGIGASNATEGFEVRGLNAKIGCNMYVMSNLGIGKSNPGYALDVKGDINFANGALRSNGILYVGSQWSNNSTNVFLLGSNVGIGASNATEGLDVRSLNAKIGCNLYVMSNLGIGKSNPGYALDVGGDINFGGILRSGGVPYIGSQWSNNSMNVFLLGSNVGIGASNATEGLDVRSLNAKIGCNLYVMSNLGIGRSNPTAALDVVGNAYFESNVTIMGILTVNNVEYITSNIVINNSEIVNSNISTNTLSFSNNLSSIFLGSSNSNLGIGTLAPLESLSIIGSNMSISNASGKVVFTSSNGNLGIAKSNPGYTLDVNGGINFTTGLYQNGIAFNSGQGIVSSQWSNNTSNVFLLGCNVGIGTSNPLAQLHLTSNLRVDGGITLMNNIQFGCLEILSGSTTTNSAQIILATSNIKGYSNLTYTGSNGTMFSIMSNTVNDSFRFVSGVASNEIVRITGNGFIGIGTSNPGGLLAVAGAASIGAAYSNVAGPVNGMIVQGNVGIGTSNPAYALSVNGINSSVNGPHATYYTSTDNYPLFQQLNWNHDNMALMFDSYYSVGGWTSSSTANNFQIYKNGGNLNFNYAHNVTVGSFLTAFSNAMTISGNNGNIGIGTSNPGSLLAVAGGQTVGAAYSNIAAPTNGLIVQGNVGIGTSSPQYTLDINGSLNALNLVGIILPFAGTTPPNGFLLCYGQTISRTIYSNLFSIISTTYGAGDGSTTYTLPDLRGRIPYGLDNMGGSLANRVSLNSMSNGSAGNSTAITLGGTGGSELLHAHTHSNGNVIGIQAIGSAGIVGSPSFGVTYAPIPVTGGGNFQNMPPCIMINYIIKY